MIPKFVIEHLEPRVWKWSLFEYEHISALVGKKNLLFSNVKNSVRVLGNLGSVDSRSVVEFADKSACILDPEADKELFPDEAKCFSQFIFGGILGDDPPKARTRPLLSSKVSCASRNLGKSQFSTDNAVLVVKKILEGFSLSELKFQDGFEVAVREGESILLPYRYVLLDGKPFVSEGLVNWLKKRKCF